MYEKDGDLLLSSCSIRWLARPQVPQTTHEHTRRKFEGCLQSYPDHARESLHRQDHMTHHCENLFIHHGVQLNFSLQVVSLRREGTWVRAYLVPRTAVGPCPLQNLQVPAGRRLLARGRIPWTARSPGPPDSSSS